MKKKIKIILSLSCVSFLCAGAAACVKKTAVEEYQEEGYKISVTYDANGGSFLNRPGVTVMDMFNPSDYTVDGNGFVHIKLIEPTSNRRPTSGTERISLTMPDHFFAGWYQTREVKLVDGSPVAANGRKLEQKDDGSYVYAELQEGEEATAITPVYEYSDYWDFETDTVDYSESESGGEKYSMTLYAGWVEYYEFNYWYENENGAWTKMAETTKFDYKTTNAANSSTSDKDTIFLPEWDNGAMKYTHLYANHSEYVFPKLAGKTFSKAYTDKECTQEIVGTLEHQGTLTLETCTAENRVQNVYVKYDEGERYQISTAKQLIDNPNLKGYYEIQADLDFTDLAWPTTFAYGTFTGQMYGKNGTTYKIKNVSVKYNSESVKKSGMFGQIAETAKLENLTFENVTFDLSYTGYRVRERSYGLFAGFIADGATITNVAVGGTFKIGKITLTGDNSLNLYANGNTQGLVKNGVALQVYGLKEGSRYEFTVIPDGTEEGKTAADTATGEITLQFAPSSVFRDQEIYNIDLT